MENDQIFKESIIVLKNNTSYQDKQILLQLIKRIPFFNNFINQAQYDKSINDLQDILQFIEYPAGNFILHKGQANKMIYILLEGSVSIYSPKLSHEIQEEIYLLNQIGYLTEKLSQQEEKESKAFIKINKKIEQCKTDLKRYECEYENQLISKDKKLSKIYLKTQNSFTINIFKKEKEIQRGDVFGEVDWQEKQILSASIFTNSNCKFACFSNQFFLENFQMQKKKDIIMYFKNIIQIKNQDIIGNMSSYFQEEKCQRNQKMCVEGQLADTLYIVKQGQLEMIKYNHLNGHKQLNYNNDSDQINFKGFSKKIEIINIKILEKGDVFGHEDEPNQTRSYSVINKSAETVIYSLKLKQLYKISDIETYKNIIDNGKTKKMWLDNRYSQLISSSCQSLNKGNIRDDNSLNSSNHKLKIEDILEDQYEKMFQQKIKDSSYITNDSSSSTKILLEEQNNLIQNQEIQKQNQQRMKNYENPIQLSSDGLNFEQTRAWIKQYQYTHKRPKLKINKQILRMKKFSSSQKIINYCQNNELINQQNKFSSSLNHSSLTQLDESASPFYQSPFFYTRHKRKLSSSNMNRSFGSIKDIENKSKSNSVFNEITHIQNKSVNLDKSLQKQNQLSDKKNQDQENILTNIHAQNLKEQKKSKGNLILNKFQNLISKQMNRKQINQLNIQNNAIEQTPINKKLSMTSKNLTCHSFRKSLDFSNQLQITQNNILTTPVSNKRLSTTPNSNKRSSLYDFCLNQIQNNQNTPQNNKNQFIMASNNLVNMDQTQAEQSPLQIQAIKAKILLSKSMNSLDKKNVLNDSDQIKSKSKQNFQNQKLSRSKQDVSNQIQQNQSNQINNQIQSNNLFYRTPQKINLLLRIQQKKSITIKKSLDLQFSKEQINTNIIQQNESTLDTNLNIQTLKLNNEEGKTVLFDNSQYSSITDSLNKITSLNMIPSLNKIPSINMIPSLSTQQKITNSQTEIQQTLDLLYTEITNQNQINQSNNKEKSKLLSLSETLIPQNQKQSINQSSNSKHESLSTQACNYSQEKLQFYDEKQYDNSPKHLNVDLSKFPGIQINSYSYFNQSSNSQFNATSQLRKDSNNSNNSIQTQFNKETFIKRSSKNQSIDLENSVQEINLNSQNNQMSNILEEVIPNQNSQQNLEGSLTSSNSEGDGNFKSFQSIENIKIKKQKKKECRLDCNLEQTQKNNSIQVSNINQKSKNSTSQKIIKLKQMQQSNQNSDFCEFRVKVKELLKKQTNDSEFKLAVHQRRKSFKCKYGSMNLANIKEENQLDQQKQTQTDQQLFEEKKKEILNRLKEQEQQQLNSNITITNNEQKKDLNFYQRSQLQKQYNDFLKYYHTREIIKK